MPDAARYADRHANQRTSTLKDAAGELDTPNANSGQKVGMCCAFNPHPQPLSLRVHDTTVLVERGKNGRL